MIYVPIVDRESGKQQWVIIELQGTLHNCNEAPLNGCDLGTLQWTNGNPVLRIGNHLCEGKVVKLQKPILVTSRGEDSESEHNGPHYVIEAIVREKLLFSNRPRPLL
ncbi:chromosome transmission fidelity protein 8 [Blastocystis sp. ATCC 50177/Nand II]|uniref:Chromosome transmission fidelity protein 8 n=1 Tax=Blastocystis sp. subtype 1 (strain ATCC 50177 / NandII) TaxID=478820 RepID=A0A196SCY1_BLAHN|nr:chromosome transmission fidelity protein 8 [Blastocystis sp. ATCC 50177/Nand II]